MGLLLFPIFIAFVFIVSLVGLILGKLVAKWQHSARWGVDVFFWCGQQYWLPKCLCMLNFITCGKHKEGFTSMSLLVRQKICILRKIMLLQVMTIIAGKKMLKYILDYGYASIENRSDKGDLYRYWHDKDG